VSNPHDRQADRLPANFGHADAGAVLPGYVPGTVQVSVNLVSALSAPKEGLRRAVAPMHMSTLVATLARVPGIDSLHDGANCFSLVGDETSKLGVAPTREAPTLATAALLGASADLGQVLDHDHTARSCARYDLLGEHMVAIPPKQSLSAAHRFQMALGRFRAFGLEFAPKPEIPRFNLLPFSLPEKTGVGCDGWPVDAEINPNNATGWNKFRWLDVNDEVQPPPRGTSQQVCRGKAGSLVEPPLGLTVRRERQLDPACRGGKPDNPLLLLDTEAAGVVTHHAAFPMRCRTLLAFLLQGKGRFQRFRRLHPCRDYKLGRQVGMRLTQVGICRPMQRDAVLLATLPTQRGDGVKASARCRQRRGQDCILLSGQLKSNAHSALASKPAERKRKAGPPCAFLLALRGEVSNAWSLR
jgi:hypothetical protein